MCQAMGGLEYVAKHRGLHFLSRGECFLALLRFVLARVPMGFEGWSFALPQSV